MRRGAPQDQELVGPGAPGRGSRGAPPPSGSVVPVLVFPPDLVFRADQRSGPRQLLTLYNPTGAVLRFRVLCTAPAKYTVFDAEGYVKPQSCIDIVIRHVAPNPRHYNVQDRFRIELSEEGTEGRVVGRKDITSVLRAPAYPLELQGQSDPTPHAEPHSWTAPSAAQPFPEIFRADQRSGPRQLLTLYNPTGAVLRFRVLCTAPAKYTVFDAEGYVKPQSCIDIVIRHVAPNPRHYNVQDRFRIELSEEGTEGRVVGRKDITSVLRAPAYPLELQGQSDPTPHAEPHSWTAPSAAQPFPENPHPQLATSSFLLFLLMGTISVAFLLLPLQDELGSQLPQMFHVSLGQKLVAAYVLGLLTMVFLRT
ncbi:MOSPD3 [Cervus elaphus hippelaphus]|uniref:Motile sperm domain-containing protein 3 n=1 Tax=Cervus elaphus hippelaphus TaxID=46360 RepID=A0A212CY89_CEREH|nr:MOSPD3 [Cervus elaphus hippelaphus]